MHVESKHRPHETGLLVRNLDLSQYYPETTLLTTESYYVSYGNFKFKFLSSNPDGGEKSQEGGFLARIATVP